MAEYDQFADIKNRPCTVAEMLEKGQVQTVIGEFKKRCECYAIAIQNGFLTVDEVRKLEGLSEIKSDN